MNVYEIRKNEGLYFSISTSENENFSAEIELKKRSIVVVYLYYKETVERYLHYIRKLSKNVRILVITADVGVKKVLSAELGDIDNCEIIIKENRGRDISALLIAAKTEVLQYDYLWFLHDKIEKNKYQKAGVLNWVMSMWENLVYSDAYMTNILKLFYSEKNIGLLLPVLPIDEDFNLESSDGWGKNNFENAIMLKRRMKLKCDLDEIFPPLSYGTMFVCRVEALRKLFELGLDYEDFPEEPMADDGEIGHAIERILPHIAQDAGYKTASIMTEIFCRHQFAILKHRDRLLTQIVSNELGLYSSEVIDNFNLQKERLWDFTRNKNRIYIYGAGSRGVDTYNFVTKVIGIIPDGFIDRKLCGGVLKGLPVKALKEIEPLEDTGIIIGVGAKFVDEVKKELQDNGFVETITYGLTR